MKRKQDNIFIENVVIYARYSSEKQNEQSIEGQVDICKEFAERNGYNVLNVYADRAISGRRFDRPQFQKMICDSNSKEFQAILVYKLDRFGRDKDQTGVFRALLKQRGVKVISATENIPENGMGVVLEGVIDGMNEFYSINLSENVSRGMNQNAHSCKSNGGKIPFGYKTVDKQIVLDEQRCKYVPIIFQMYNEGTMIKDIISYLNEMGVRNSRGKPLVYNSINSILKNRKYLGIYRYNGFEIPDAIPRLVSDEQFSQAQKQMEKNKHHRTRNKAKEEYLLTTKLFCGDCKCKMVGNSAKSHTGKIYRYYVCKQCKRKISKNEIESFVVDHSKSLLTKKNIKLITRELIRINRSEPENLNLKQLKSELRKKEKEMNNLIDSLKECEFAEIRSLIFNNMNCVENEIQDIKNQISMEKMKIYHFTEEEIKSFLVRLKNNDISSKFYNKTLIDVFVNKVFIYDDKITIVFNIGESLTSFNDLNLNQIENESNNNVGLDNTPKGSPNKYRYPFGCLYLFLK
ncbi:MAG: recombinase family protein [Clostridia bacterium]|nr:recombinase family protein [Clostridia bacterium]